ncbi:MAG: MBL fold metallo-hydrolase [Eubacteriales bacterium]|nr:MBL fold metallo-hydrolase [Eubacteriales bacterium]
MDILSLRSGSRGNASLVSGGNTKLLVDCGVSGKSVTSALADVDVYPEDISAIAVTHEHIDHIAGIGVMMRRYHIPVWANAATWTAMESQVGKIDKSLVNIFDNDSSFEIGEIGVKPFSIPHDAADPVGYSFMCGDEKVAVATDIGELKKDLFEAIRGSKTVLLESNHDVNMLEIGKYPPQLKRRIRGKLGHLSNDDAGRAAEFLVLLGTERIILGHLSEENNYPELARQTVICVLNDAGIKCGRDVLLGVALPQQTVSLCG